MIGPELIEKIVEAIEKIRMRIKSLRQLKTIRKVMPTRIGKNCHLRSGIKKF